MRRRVGDELYDGSVSGTAWGGFLPFEALPHTVDPPSAWLQNANGTPWTSTFPTTLRPEEFPPWVVVPRDMSLREQRSAQLVSGEPVRGVGDLAERARDCRVLLADRILDDLLALVEDSTDPLLAEAAEILRGWDRTVTEHSRGAFLFILWAVLIAFAAGPDAEGVFATPWDPDDPLRTPHGLADGEAAVRALADACRLAQDAFGRLDPAWGEAVRLRDSGGTSVPAEGGPGDPFGIFRSVAFELPLHKQQDVTFGDTFVAAVEFSAVEERAEGRVLLAYPNGERPDAPPAARHYYDGSWQSIGLSGRGGAPVGRDTEKTDEHDTPGGDREPAEGDDDAE